MPGSHGNAAERWFGPHFSQLHPLLQALHRDGGTLRGEVAIGVGTGLARPLGRRLAARLGIPTDRPRRGFDVLIHHDDRAMQWRRRFDDGSELFSEFRPVGRYPGGHWLETTGPVQMRLGVDLADGGWRWRVLAAHWRGWRLPLALFPRTHAYKRIENASRYRFAVSFSLPLLGELLRYEGALTAVASDSTFTSIPTSSNS